LYESFICISQFNQNALQYLNEFVMPFDVVAPMVDEANLIADVTLCPIIDLAFWIFNPCVMLGDSFSE